MLSSNTEMLKAMLRARTELVMNYLNYVELISTQLLSQTDAPKTARDCTFDERDRECMKARLIKAVEVYSHYFCRFNQVTGMIEQELTRRVMENVYPPVLPVALQAPKRSLYPGDDDDSWLSLRLAAILHLKEKQNDKHN